MANYMIHACPKRMWYVEQYLVPSMLKQGIDTQDIVVYNDTEGDGNLESCLKSFASMPDNSEGTWHLQDDVLISSTFKQQTERNDFGIVYGFSGYYDKDTRDRWFLPGFVEPKYMWSSFQCVRIPNYTARKFVKWFRQYMEHNHVYRDYVKTGKCDDWFFKLFCQSKLQNMKILNLAPNIVEHVDQLLGGSVINEDRCEPEYRARYWVEEDLYNELKEALKERADK